MFTKGGLLKLYYKDDYCTITQGNCLEVMTKMIEKGLKFDAIITDPPYGTTYCKWDSIIPLDAMWECLNKLVKDNAPIVLFGGEPFSSFLRCSNIKDYKYDWVWKKTMATLFQHANKRPMKIYENISVFYKHLPTYNPIMSKRDKPYTKKTGDRKVSGFHNNEIKYKPNINKDTNFPTDVIEFSNGNHARLHPTQKPLDLMEYLVNTYTNEGDTILDFTCGSGTTLVAAKRLKRKCYGIETEEKYCEITKNRLLEIT